MKHDNAQPIYKRKYYPANLLEFKEALRGGMKPNFRFFKGEADNPFDSRTDFSCHVFWEMESAAAAQGGSFKKLAEGPVPEIVRNWKADPEARGLLVFIMLMCGKWRPEDYGDVEWELYTQTPAEAAFGA